MTASHARLRQLTVRVPAKVNLELAVGPLREDGFHSLSTIFHAVDLFDDVTATLADDIEIGVAGRRAEAVPADSSNLAYRAAALMQQKYDVRSGVRLHINKAIPVAGGMAGGSADAAAALVACDALWGLGLGRQALEELAAQLGSDVPFALSGGTALGTGRGEQVAPVLATGRFEWLFALTHSGLSTPQVYRECDRLRAHEDVPEPHPSQELLSALRTGDVAGVAKHMDNDLEPAALSLKPQLEPLMDMGMKMGALRAMVSGSGPTVAFLLEDRPSAVALKRVLEAGSLADEYVLASSTSHGTHVVTGP